MKEALKKFWKFLHEDSWLSLIVFLIIAFIVLMVVLFPLLKFVTGTTLPLVIVESCSMHHDEIGFEDILNKPIYSQNGIVLEEAENWAFQRGLGKGDIIFVVRPTNIEVGDVLIFSPNADARTSTPIIHRVVDGEAPYGTYGDNNPAQLRRGNNPNNIDETNIQESQLIGKAIFRIPAVGWIKLIFFDWRSSNPGLCD